MLKLLNSAYRFILNIGIEDSYSAKRKNRIRIINSILIISIIISPAYIVLLNVLGLEDKVWPMYLSFFLNLFAYFLNYKKFYQTSSFILIGTLLFVVSYFLLIYGSGIGIELWFAVIVSMSFILVFPEKLLISILFLIFSIILCALLFLVPVPAIRIGLSVNVKAGLSIANIASSFGILYMLLRIYKNDLDNLVLHLDQLVEKKTLQIREKSNEVLKAKDSFLANMSHEIRTPISGILGMTRLLESAQLTDPHASYLRSISNSGNTLLKIINDVLDLSKIKSGKLQLEKIGFKLEEVSMKSIDNLNALASKKKLSLENSIDENLKNRILVGDSLRLTQVINNLIGNAIKFTNEGVIKFTAKTVNESSDAVTVKFSVSDDGIGISTDKLKSIFEPFEQSDSSTTREYGGSGLGLSICKLLIELQNGRVWAESIEGKGSTFHFEIEYKKGREEDLIQEKEGEIIYDIKGVSVLLVEDNLTNQVYAETLLKEFETIIDIAGNGLEAVDALKKKSYDIILMDMQMPIMDGEVATKIIRNELNISTPIIALTANALKGDEERYITFGMNGYISKPFKDSVLNNKIGELLNIKPSKNELTLSPFSKNNEPIIEIEKTVFSLDNLTELSRGNQEFVDKMVELFLQEMPNSLLLLSQHLEKKEYDRIKAIVHKIKPSIEMMGISEIVVDANEVESFIDTNTNMDKVPEKVIKIIAFCNKAVGQLKKMP